MARASFSDLAARTGSAAVMALLGFAAVWYGGAAFLTLCALVAGLMVWELARMQGAPQPPQPALVAAAAVLAAPVLPAPWGALGLLVVPAMAALVAPGRRLTFALGAAAMVVATSALVVLRADDGPVWMLWLVLVVIASDVAGYFAGRLIGGPKFWPRISPKKTWSGTVAGWICAALVGLVFAASIEGVWANPLMALSVAMCLAAQLGDVAESWIKRRAGVKDASNILPGHGGLMDRFDGLVGAALVLALYAVLFAFPPGLGG
ncbi:phosphatidate cytidylyltransferase [Maritimibacter sp. 55A14]|uniref:phosphatidate cytidylyltransferase n=1 Tax=Maritimibacter sp. 55A14 TaxID=2174844 RepID=UPI000D60D071|nr:phosphatidate cytidylyltransferase [Maritimibacter sp. 55A14]PWE34294.1 phosphatidate cytidylyltransferase [Maritimibacter sp. 55A14]